ncbi:MAG TPA: hypothetical protein VKU85_04325, partial [bacterium]|nr:hypothetical protein [bacterium]
AEGQLHPFSFPAVTRDSPCKFLLLAGDCNDEHRDGLWFTFGTGSLPVRLIGGDYPTSRNLLGARRGAQFDVVQEDRLRAPAGADRFGFQVESPTVPRGDSGVLAVAALCLEPVAR